MKKYLYLGLLILLLINSRNVIQVGAQTNGWTKMEPPSAPPARYDFPLTYDEKADQIILFSGTSDSYSVFEDTWAYDDDSNTWSNMAPASSPPGSVGYNMIYDSESERIILFGGINWSGVTIEEKWVCQTETWVYDYETNIWTNMTPDMSPPGRAWYSMAYDAESDRVIIFGGFWEGTINADTWVYDYNDNNWTQMFPIIHPSQRFGQSMVYDAESDQIILFGGIDQVGTNSMPERESSETWAYDYNENTWRNMTPATRPTARSSNQNNLVYDMKADRVILFGGETIEGNYFDDTWTYDYETDNWENMKCNIYPSERSRFNMAYDMDSNQTILFGGGHSFFSAGLTVFSDTWTYQFNPPSSESGNSSSGVFSFIGILILTVRARRRKIRKK